MIEEAVVELVPHIHEVQTRLNTERLDIITENSDIELVYLTPEEREAFRELSMPIRDTFVEMVGERGERLMNALLEQVDAAQGDTATDTTAELQEEVEEGASEEEMEQADAA